MLINNSIKFSNFYFYRLFFMIPAIHYPISDSHYPISDSEGDIVVRMVCMLALFQIYVGGQRIV